MASAWANANKHRSAALTPRETAIHDRKATLAYGDFTQALKVLDDLDRLDESSTDATPHWQSTRARVEVLLEMGRRDDASAALRDFKNRVAGYVKELSPAADAAFHHRTFDLGIVTSREDLDRALHRVEKRAQGTSASQWMLAYAAGNPTAADAEHAVEKAPPEADLDSLRETTVDPEALFRVGVTLLRAGKAARAKPWLEAATRPCVWYEGAEEKPVEAPHVHAYFALGEAYEKLGEKERARTAYGEVVRRWKNAKPSSVTLDAARARLNALK
jgi:tetratricopeptide (TPR) repeat protein